MVVADVAFLIIVLGLLGIGGKSLFSAWGQARENHKERLVEQIAQRDHLRQALASRDPRKLEDFLVVWGDKMTKAQHDHVKQRIDELIVEENP